MWVGPRPLLSGDWQSEEEWEEAEKEKDAREEEREEGEEEEWEEGEEEKDARQVEGEEGEEEGEEGEEEEREVVRGYGIQWVSEQRLLLPTPTLGTLSQVSNWKGLSGMFQALQISARGAEA